MPDTAAQNDEQDFSIPGQDGTQQQAAPSGPSPQVAQSVMRGDPSQPMTGVGMSDKMPADVASTMQPKISGKAMFLGNLLKTLMSGAMTGMAQGNPNNAFDRGAAAASPQAQQARQQQQQLQQQKIQEGLDTHQMNIVKMEHAKMQDAVTAHNLLHADDARQQAIMDNASNEYDALDGKGLISDKQAIDGEGMKSYGDAVKYAGAQQAKIGYTSKERYMVFSEGNDLDHAKFIVGKVNPQDTVKDADGNEYSVSDYMHLNASDRSKIGKSAVKERIKDMQGTYYKPLKESDIRYGEERDAQVGQADSDLKTPGVQGTEMERAILTRKAELQEMKPAFQSPAEERKAQEKDKAADRAATRAASADKSLMGKDVIVHGDEGEVLMSAHQAQQQGFDDFSTLTSQKAQDLKDRRANADASMDAMTNYEDTFRESAPKLSKSDRDALRVLTSHVQEHASSGLLGGIIEDLPLVGPLNSYSNKLLEGTMKSDQYNNMSPAGKKMIAQYAMAVVANFANMKQMLGSVGRNPQMIQAEMAQIPLPYIDADSAHQAFRTKIDDLNKRNSSIPKVYSKREEKLKRGLSKLAGQE